MILSEFRELVRLYVPAAKEARISDAQLDLLINRAVNDVNEFGLVYQNDKKVNVVEDEADIVLSTTIDDYLTIDNSGIWWNSGTALIPNWIKLEPKTKESLDSEYPIWRDDSANDPQRYFIEGNKIKLHPKPDTTLDDGLWVFYCKVATSMTANTHYPFTGSETEITSFRVLDDAIIDYVRWKLARPLGKDEKGIVTEQDYKENLLEKTRQLKRRKDLTSSYLNRMRGVSLGK